MLKHVCQSACAAVLRRVGCVTGCSTVGTDFVAPPRQCAGQPPPPSAAGKGASARLPAAVVDRVQRRHPEQPGTARAARQPGREGAAQRLLQAQAQLGVYPRRPGAEPVGERRRVEFAHLGRDLAGLALGGRSIEGNNFSVGASLSYELDLWGRVRRVVEAADAQALAAQDDRDGVLLLLSSAGGAPATGSCAGWMPNRRSCATRWPPGARRRNWSRRALTPA
jgi:multidrug efflux system outer membrane protein